MRRRHRFNGCPREGVLALGKLLEPLFVTTSAGLGGYRSELMDVVCAFVTALVAVAATDVLGAVSADFPVRDNIARFLAVTLDAVVSENERAGEHEKRRDEGGTDYGMHRSTPVVILIGEATDSMRATRNPATMFRFIPTL